MFFEGKYPKSGGLQKLLFARAEIGLGEQRMAQVEAWAKLGVVWNGWEFGPQGPLSSQDASVPCDHTLFFLLGAFLCPFVSRCGQWDHCRLGL